ncbi:MAG: phosphoglycolate phosphatase [Candidatus Marinimicrobia bacterium]|nr:phosphoglycolate phosphatase [Candidatus Neomarinimicrobiota bacterium]MCF7830294.1 phosphoglycolate phosphatase [Candidatus Neomarinimicrobiota bacterium]MCF7882435.1 phosphoglycolate phosphatase [Candidatus Neomarinimicrobiota bacterium]
MQLPALIFDLDGTLLDSSPDLALAVNSLLDELGYPPLSVEKVTEFIGDGTPKLAERSLIDSGAIDSPDEPRFDDYFQRLLVFYEENLANKTTIFPGVREFLEDHKEHPMAVVTNKPDQFTRPVLEAFKLADYFSFIAGGDRYAKRKPDPYPVEQAMASLGVRPEQTVMIGDGDTDILAGNAAGATTVAVLFGNRSPEELKSLNPDYTITAFSQLTTIIGNLKNPSS